MAPKFVGFREKRIAITQRPGIHVECAESKFLTGQEPRITEDVTHKTLPVSSGKLPSGDTSSDRALQTLCNWIDTCVDNHEDCAGRKVAQLPKRVLEIDGRYVYLRECFDTPAIYACLSHCWGPKGPTMRLDKASRARLIKGIVIDELPKTFSDSVHLCSRLDIRFIWIDACCELYCSVVNMYVTKGCAI